jgi:hypothetical protein
VQIEIPAQLAVIQNLLEAIERCLWIGKEKSKSSASIEHTRQATVVTPKLCEMESLVAKPTVASVYELHSIPALGAREGGRMDLAHLSSVLQ